ncbi:MAG: PTS transporter subunit EIIC [Christensenellaceae bacterium]|nr:PTS transporter subunit EIIC [Christensenellaceae bacterium]
MAKEKTLSGKEMLEEKKKFNVFDMIGGIFKPILIVIIGAGVLQALRDILLQIGAISRVSSSYIFLDGLGNAVFYFLPIFLAISSANVFGATPFLAAAVAAFLLYPNITNLFSWANSVGWDLTLFGKIPITYVKYESSVLPIILIVFFQSKIEPLLKKTIPDLLRSILFPVLTLFITCLAGIIILGPIGTWVGDGLAFVITWLNTRVPWLVPTLVGAASPFLVITGSHYSLFPVATQNLAQLGYDTVLMPGMMASNIALAGASFAVAVRAKQKSYKSYCASSGITSFFGISQSSLYGIAIPLQKPLIASVIGGGLAGFYAGITGIRAQSFVTPGLLSLVGYSTPTSNLINAVICIAIAFVATFVLTLIMGFQEPSKETVRELTGEPISESEKQEILDKAEELEATARKTEEALGDAAMETTRATITRGATRIGEATGLVSASETESEEENGKAKEATEQKGEDA